MLSRLGYPLPAPSTLRKWVSKFDCSPGILHDVLHIMKHMSQNYNEFQKIVTLSFDKTSLHKQMCLDRKEENIFGPQKNASKISLLHRIWDQEIKLCRKSSIFHAIILYSQIHLTTHYQFLYLLMHPIY
ncbi:hypothetical protein PR048_009372 [Dryococelus australis]|uniref:Transposable element P transposase-like RNase H domain-containing protein n=1 Tax=Dryococelus australis TaxID=614101 RepID=A0ABQ9I024_9NEOP|nr:hypothetical protein PR048_009372 [Dryococelus australis]